MDIAPFNIRNIREAESLEYRLESLFCSVRRIVHGFPVAIMAVSYRHGLSILEVVVYIPALFMALWMAYRHGFGRSSGWIFFVIFSLLRVIGSCCYLATISNPTSTNLYITWAVCNSIGLSPLTLACIGLLSRV